MDIEATKDSLAKFIESHQTHFDNLGRRQWQVFEVCGLVVAVDHYARKGYRAQPQNLHDAFRVKAGARGRPWEFSWFRVCKGDSVFEVHANLAVLGCLDDSSYIVDVGVIQADATFRSELPYAVANRYLATFMECKSFEAYPMLLAHFAGIVREITPEFVMSVGGWRLCPSFFVRGHFLPVLATRGVLSAASQKVARNFSLRGYLLKVVPSLDAEVVKLGSCRSSPPPLD